MNRLPRLLQFTVTAVVLYLLFFSTLRIVFWGWFGDPADPIPGPDLFTAFYLGLKFDLRLALLLVLPLLALGWLRWFNPFTHRWAHWLWTGYFALSNTAVLLVFFIHFGHYDYLHKPLDATVLRFADNLAISAQMVWETYPVLWGVIGLVVFTALNVWGAHRLLDSVAARQPVALRRRHKTTFATATVLLVLFGLYGQLSWYPLRWSNAFFSTHAFAAAVTVNPVLHFFDTLKNRSINFDRAAAVAAYPRIVEFLGIDEPDEQSLNYLRVAQHPENAARRPNVIMVFLESYASFKTGIYGNPLNPTPHFDELARNGIYFENFYTPQPGTARSVFTAITGIPDPEVVRTATRNPLVVDQHTIINDFEGYEKLYFLGGSASWGNIRGLLSRNIPGLRIFEEGSYASPRQDVWGIADHHLFEEANAVLKTVKDKPFFAIIQTAGNHRPYTIPEDRHGFEMDMRDEQELHKYGFESNAEYNAFRYMDYSIGLFLQEAKNASYFSNTVFVFFGDHGLPGSGAHLTKADQLLSLNTIHVPFVIYAPDLLGPGRVEHKVASELDVLPTVAGRVLPTYRNTTLGRDLLDERFDDQRYAFTILNSSNPDIGLIGDGFYLRTKADDSKTRLHQMQSDDPRKDVQAEHPEQTEKMRELTRSIFETARFMLYHNGQYRLEPETTEQGR
jgi:phosphoglycerol transferase MdoB-like AlkP superfamily enzyme